MKHRRIWLWPLGLAALLVALTNETSWSQEPDKQGPKTEGEARVIKDVLTGNEPRDLVRLQSAHKVYDHTLVKGKTYRFDLESTEFDPYLRLVDPKGVQVAEDDDSGGKLNALISYKAEDSGTFRVVVTGFGNNTRGKFTLTIREIAIRDATPSELKLSEDRPTIIKDKLTVDNGIDPRGRPYRAYVFACNKATLYRVNVKDLASPRLRVEDDAGRVVRRSTLLRSGESTVTFRPKTDGSYRVLVGTNIDSPSPGNFQLSITPSMPVKAKTTSIDTAGPIKLDAQLTSEDGTDRDGKHCRIYSFKADVGKEYRFEARGNADPRLRLEDETGKGLQEEDYGDVGYSRLGFRPTKMGVYHLVVAAGRADQIGDFTLTGGDRLSLAAKLAIAKEPSKLSSQLSRDDELDSQARHHKTYVFQAEQGKIYRFEVAGDFAPWLSVEPVMAPVPKDVMPPIDPILKVGGASPLTSGAFRIYVPFKNGPHYFTVAAASGQTGAYSLTAATLDAKSPKPIPPDYREVTIRVAKIAGTLTENDGITPAGQPYQLIVLKAEPGRLYNIKLTVPPGTALPMMQLEGLKREVLRTALVGPNNSRILSYLSAKPAEHRIAIIGFLNQRTKFNMTITESEYSAPKMNVERVVVNSGKTTNVPQQITEQGINANGQPFQLVVLKSEAKKLYNFRLPFTPGGPTPVLQLEGPKGEVLRTGVFAPGNALTLMIPSLKASEYRVAVVGVLDANITHTLTITESTYIPPKVAVEKVIISGGKTISSTKQIAEEGQSASGQAAHLVAIKAEPKKLYEFRLNVPPSGSIPSLQLEGPKGELLQSGKFGPGSFLILRYTPTQAVNARLAVIGIVNPTVAYKLSITESDYTPPKAEKLIVAADKPAMVSNELKLGDPQGDINKLHKLYSFEAKQGVTYQLDLHSTAFDAYLYLRDEQNNILAENDDVAPGNLDSRIVFTMKKAGTYRIVATSLNGVSTGAYTLTVREVGAAPK